MVSRRGFLARLGLGAAAVIAAPLIGAPTAALFIPSSRLEMGVPHAFASASLAPSDLMDESAAREALTVVPEGWRAPYADQVSMQLLYDEYMSERGGRLQAGSVLLVDEKTADRWTASGVAVPTDTRRAERLIRGRPQSGPDWRQQAADPSRYDQLSWLYAPQSEQIDMSAASAALKRLVEDAPTSPYVTTWARLS